MESFVDHAHQYSNICGNPSSSNNVGYLLWLPLQEPGLCIENNTNGLIVKKLIKLKLYIEDS